MPQLDTSTFTSQLFWLVVCFLALYLILSYIAVPKITRVLETREEVLEEKINKASTYREEAEGLLAEYETILAEAKKNAHQHYKSATRTTSADRAQKQKVLLDALNDRLHLADQHLYRARLEASKETKSIAIELATAILKKMTGRTHTLDKPIAKKENS